MSEEKSAGNPLGSPQVGVGPVSSEAGGLASLAGNATKLQAVSAAAKLKEILAELETEEGLAKLSSGDLKFEIKSGAGVLWYVAYGTT